MEYLISIAILSLIEAIINMINIKSVFVKRIFLFSKLY